MCKVSCQGAAGEGVTRSARLSEEMGFEPGLQECCALLALGRGWEPAAWAGWANRENTGHMQGATGGVK